MRRTFTKHLVLLMALYGLVFNALNAQLPAFPSAEGFGKYTTGGRGGEVYHVTNLNDSGPGSFRDAVSQSYRIVVFDVGGVINISSRIVISHHVYVAGQTAPGGGITIYGNGIAFNGDSGDNIIRYIRIRMGKNGDSGKDAVAISENQNYIFDHVSISWGRDGTLDVNGSGVDNLTFQDCIISQGINNSNHSTGGLMQSGKWSVIRSLYHSNKTRNPKARGTHEFINSVLYNWASNGYIMGDTEGLSECNMIGNHFIYGPSSSSGAHITRTTPSFHVYGADNWIDDNKNGVLDAYQMTDYKTATVVNAPYNYPGVNNLLSASDALNHVLDHVGASLSRDEVDELLINQVKSYGTQGQIINTEDDNGINGNVGYVANGTPPTDTDQDGMPDQWEIERGLNPNVADDKGDDDGDGYTNIEEYLSCIVGEGDACTFNPFIDCAGVENGEAYLDECGECVAGTTGKTACVIDCAGVENGSATIDQCGVCSGGTTGVEACTGVLQGENACAYDGSVDSDNEGFQGEGFMNFTNTTGSFGTYYLLSDNAQTITVGIRYANGGGSARPMTIAVNGNNQATFQANNTGGWTTWQTESITLNLAAGTNTVTLTATTGDGGPNLDLISIPEDIIATCEEDCHGDVAGGASLDLCGTCSGGNTGITPNSTCTQEPYGGTPHPIPGTIQFEDFDVGPNGLAYYDDSQGTSTGVDFRTDTDVDIEICTDAGGGYNIGYATAGEWLEYTVNVEETGQYDIDLRVATTGSGKSLSLSMDGTPLVIDLAIASTGDWQAWENVTVNDVTLQAGEQILRLTMGPADYINLNYVTFAKVVLDADNDGTPDDEDGCPNDPNKVLAGNCGCGYTEQSCLDCAGIPNGTTEYDDCGVCGGTNACVDCAGTPNGDAYYDNCDNCVGGITSLTPCTQDCSGEWGGTASYDACNECSGGSTGLVPVTDPAQCIATSIDELESHQIRVYPNPTTGKAILSQSKAWQLYNAQGKLVLTGNGKEIDLKTFTNGLYLIKTVSETFHVIKH